MLLLIKKIGVIFSVLSEIESLELEFLDLIDNLYLSVENYIKADNDIFI